MKLMPRFSKKSATILLGTVGMPWWNEAFVLLSQIALHELLHSTGGLAGLV